MNWEAKLVAIRQRQAEIHDAIQTLERESNLLSKQAIRYRSRELKRDHGLQFGDQLAVTEEFKAMLRERNGWDAWGINSFCRVPYFWITLYAHDMIHIGAENFATSYVPIPMVKRMRQAWLEQQTTTE